MNTAIKETDTVTAIPTRDEVQVDDTWDLATLFKNEDAWEDGLKKFESQTPKLAAFKGTLSESAIKLKAYLDADKINSLLGERLVYYAHLRVTEDVAKSTAQAKLARYSKLATEYQAASSFVVPELQAIPDDTMQSFLDSPLLKEYGIMLHRILRYKPHVLSEAEERLLALQAEVSQTPSKAFGALTDVDMDFGTIETKDGEKPLTQSTYATFLQDKDRNVRQKAYKQLIGTYEKNKHTLAALYNGSVQQDVYKARIRNYPSSLEHSLFADDVPLAVYNQLIETVRANLPALHRYYRVRRKLLNLDELRLYDTRAPLVADLKTHHTYENAVELICTSLAPLGEPYVNTLRNGLLNERWVDRYENKGKRSGAFSAGSYSGNPYILMNYKEDVLDSVFTLTHEAGHSMHSFYSKNNNPFQHYNYTIFAAEVASTFNEQLLTQYMLANNSDKNFKAFLINKEIDEAIGTIYRQTMFAEFEKTTHEMVERNEPLTVDSLTEAYQKLLDDYFGPDVVQEEESSIEGLRIPHFYSAFYVYKYATGMSASVALAHRVTTGGKEELEDYLGFLKSGGSKFPLEQLKDAGVDMTQPTAIQTALEHFSTLVDQLEEALR